MKHKKEIYEKYCNILDEKLLPLGFIRGQEGIERGAKFVNYERDYFNLMLSYEPGLFGMVKLQGTGELDLNLLKTEKEEVIEVLNNWIGMLDVWLDQNK